MVTNNDRATLGVAVAGFGWMGRVHTQAYARLRHHYPNLPLVPELVSPTRSATGGRPASTSGSRSRSA